ncbi:RmlC-like cupin domain-containing protein [Paraphysoderma sedebokerense]|nr:RmlC-like cupin domain-containing protein [Paraphysoderma sedebokerense]
MSFIRNIVKTIVAKEQAEGVGARVRRSIGTAELRNLDPFLMLDEFNVKKPAGFSDHPHRGFETVTYMIEGEFEHEDFGGHRGRIGPGDLQWMTAGRGVIHAEVPIGDGVNKGLQLWVNLPKSHKMMEPRYQEHTDKQVPRVKLDGVEIKVIAGESHGVHAKVRTITPIMYLDVNMEANKTVDLVVPRTYNSLLYILSGSAEFGGSKVEGSAHRTLVLDPAVGKSDSSATVESKLPVKSLGSGCRYVLIAGEPIGEPIVQHGPFVMTSQEEIMQAFMDYRFARNGFEKASTWESQIAHQVKGH